MDIRNPCRNSAISRRSLIQGAGALGLFSALPLKASPAIPERFDIFLRAHQNGDDTVAHFWYKGLVLGCPFGAQSKPMLSIQGFSHQRAKLLPDGTMRFTMIEAGYYGDPQTGQIADEVTNVFTGKTVRPHHYKSRQENIVAPDGTYSSPALARLPGTIFAGQLTEPVYSGDYVFFSENLETAVPGPPGAPAKGLTSLANYTARKSDLDRRAEWTPLAFDYSSIGPWSDWLEMGDLPGVQTMRLSGRKFRTGEQPPAALKARLDADHPGFIQDGGI
jgi:hypothetical protein